MSLKSSGADAASFAKLRQQVLDFTVQSGLFTSAEALRWYEQPVAEWNLIENADRSSF